MKEVTYGWYPSVHDIYRPKGRPSSYHLECLYKYNGSMYYQDKALPPKQELFVRGISSATPPPTPEDLRRRSKSAPVPKFTLIPKLHIPTPADCWAHRRPEETKWGVTGEGPATAPSPSSEVSWPLAQDKQNQLVKEHLNSSPPSVWYPAPPCVEPPLTRCGSATSQLMWPTSLMVDNVRPQSSSSGQSASITRSCATTPAPPSGKSSASSKRPSRIQSATVRRDKTALPTRPVTAGPNRKVVFDSRPVSSGHHPVDNQSLRDPNSPQVLESKLHELQLHEAPASRRPAISASESIQPPTIPFVYDVNDARAVHEKEEESRQEKVTPAQPGEEGDNYDTIVEKYGWRAQVHGDPYKLKKPMKRLSYAVNCEAPKLLPDPPNVHMESKETFFYNTIPKRPLSFAVSKEWMSEVLLAKRLDLQKREGGIKYNYKNFAFVY
ncbi:hypothetical protein Btru_001989 [Bulinus truncatus]|nr:hypothetical protein Btru_001989 [Bulinus truncatus]